MLTSLLPVSIMVQNQAYIISLHEQWGEIWKQSPWYSRLAKIDPSFPSNKYQKLTLELSWAQSSLIMQLRSGHVLLNAYAYRISKLDQPTCTPCKSSEEMVHHYLFNCKVWKQECWLLGHSLGRASKSLQSLLNSKQGVEELLKFVGKQRGSRTTASESNATLMELPTVRINRPTSASDHTLCSHASVFSCLCSTGPCSSAGWLVLPPVTGHLSPLRLPFGVAKHLQSPNILVT